MNQQPFPTKDQVNQAYLQGGIHKAIELWSTQFYPFIENIIEDKIINASASQGKPVTCRKGCYWCCHEQLLAQGPEGYAAAAWINKQPRPVRKQILKNLEKWYKETNKAGISLELNTPDDIYQLANQYWDAKIRCPFLDKDSCIIYPARPFACRTMLVTSHPDECEKSQGKAIRAKIPIFEKYVREEISHFANHLSQLEKVPQVKENLTSASWFPHITKKCLDKG